MYVWTLKDMQEGMEDSLEIYFSPLKAMLDITERAQANLNFIFAFIFSNTISQDGSLNINVAVYLLLSFKYIVNNFLLTFENKCATVNIIPDSLTIVPSNNLNLFDILYNEKPFGVIASFSRQTGIQLREHLERSFRKDFFKINFYLVTSIMSHYSSIT